MMVLPMGFNWALYFCQKILEGAVLKGGWPASALIKDRRVPPIVGDGNVVGVWTAWRSSGTARRA